DQQEHERYLQDLVRRPVQQEDASLTDEDRQRNSLLLRQAAEASSRQREDSTASSPDNSPRHNNRPSRTSSSFLSSLKQESDYSLWSRSETAGASLSADEFSGSQSQADQSQDAEVAAAPSQPREASKADQLVPFPSLPNSRLHSLSLLPASLSDLDARNGSVSLIDPSRRFRLDDIPDTELEDRVRALAISFSNDATTLVVRVKRLFLARTNQEQDISSELQALESDLAKANSGEQLPPTSSRFVVLRELLEKLNRTSEILGAVQQESRLNYAFHLMLKHMELLKEDKEKQAMDEGKFYMPDEDLMSKRSKSVIGAASQKQESQRSKFQDLGRTVARTSSITSLRRRMSRDLKSAEDPDGRDGSKDSKKWKIEEEIYQSGFERGVRMSTSQQLSQLKTEQAAFSDQLERLMDRQHLTEAEEADLDRLTSDWLGDKRLRLFLAPCTLLAVTALLIWAIAYPVAKQLLGR
uniref:BMERB domain-containing protein n=2 Tax=Macrostomum lignano TaxID=282301 RepID=A0A1I8GFA6_9PLAT